MKAVLVLQEMPDACMNCILCDIGNECIVTGKETDVEDKRMDWCPLRPMPKEIPSRDGMIKDEFKDGYREGWNDAIKAIEGSGEDEV